MILDYVNLIEEDSVPSYEEMGRIIKRFKRLAQQHKLVVIFANKKSSGLIKP